MPVIGDAEERPIRTEEGQVRWSQIRGGQMRERQAGAQVLMPGGDPAASMEGCTAAQGSVTFGGNDGRESPSAR
jgi:hypothetical protein